MALEDCSDSGINLVQIPLGKSQDAGTGAAEANACQARNLFLIQTQNLLKPRNQRCPERLMKLIAERFAEKMKLAP